MAAPAIVFAQDLHPDAQEAVLASLKVRQWLEAVTAAFDLRSVTFEQVYFFGRKVGFVVARAEAYADDGTPVPGIVLIRGEAVAILPVLITADGSRYTILVRQPRLPIGNPAYEEIPAGMVDDGIVRCKALEELREEVGDIVAFAADELTLLETVHPSPGGTDERLQIFYAEKNVSDDALRSLSGRRTGNPEEQESIIVEVIPLDDLAFRATSDMKTRLAFYSYKASQDGGARRPPGPQF